jgi:hypothetical protein
MDKTDETIVTDISEEKEAVQPALSARDSVMQGILKGRAEELLELEGQLVTDDTQQEEVILGQEADDPETVEDKFVTVKVNGRTYEVEAEKVERAGGIEAYQRTAAASEKQREVAAREAALKKREAELAEIERKLLNPEPEVEQEGNFGKQFADQIFDDPEAVAEAMNRLESRTRKAEQTTEELLQKQRQQEQKEQQTVVQYFWSNHEEIARDQEFTDALNARLPRIVEENPALSIQQAIDEAAEQVYTKFNLKKGSAGQQKETVKPDRRPTKAPPRATSQRLPEPEVKQKTPEEVVRDLAKFRTPQR